MEEDIKAPPAEEMTFKSAISNLTDSVQDLVETYYKLGVATATKKGADIAAGVVSSLLLTLVSMMAIVFAFIGLAFWIGSLINSIAGGFGIVAGFFVLVIVLIASLKSKVIHPVIKNMVVNKVYEKLDDED